LAITTGFIVDKRENGDLQVSYVEIAIYNSDSQIQLVEGKAYKVTIAMSKERFEALQLNYRQTIMTYQDPILNEEITNIEKTTG